MTGRADRILVVDDEKTNRMLLEGALTKQGYAVELATGGEEAVAKLSRAPFDLVVLDLEMPGCSGLDVIERVKADDRLRHIPIIVVSATQELEGIVRCIEAGAHDYLPKPFDPVLLDARVKSSLATKRLHDALDSRVFGAPKSSSLDADGTPNRGVLPTGAFGVVDDGYADDGCADDVGDDPSLPSSSARQAEPESASRPVPHQPASQGSQGEGRWDRFTLRPGVELHVCDSNSIPTSPEERKAWVSALLERLRAQLETYEP